MSRLPHRFNFLLALPQSDTENLLAQRLAELGVTVERRTALTGLRDGGDAVEVTLESPEGRAEATCDLVFGADGVHSTVRETLGLDFAGYTHARTWSIADAEIADWPYAPAAANLFLQQGGDVGFVIPIGPQRFRAVSNTPDALARIPGGYRVTQLLRSDTFKIPVRQVATYHSGSVYLGGDAAHVHSPVGGRGMNLGIEDAATFVLLFAEGGLEGYTAARHGIGARWIKASEGVLSAVQSTSAARVALRNAALWTVGRLPLLQRRLLARAAGLTD
jgi:2-polyprenyl-6-methoxyphenol hydroxylase-like FAD-dependent oxidoreductase